MAKVTPPSLPTIVRQAPPMGPMAMATWPSPSPSIRALTSIPQVAATTYRHPYKDIRPVYSAMSTRSGLPYRPLDFEPYSCRKVKLPKLHDGLALRLTDNFGDLLRALQERTEDLEPDDMEGMGLEVEDRLATLRSSARPVVKKLRRAELQAGIHARCAQEYKQRHRQALRAKCTVASPYKHRVRTSPTVKATLFAQPLRLDCDAHDLPHTKDGAWLGRPGLSAEVTPEIEKLIEDGYRLIKWDGRQVLYLFFVVSRLIASFNDLRTPCSILDEHDRAFVCLAGRPRGADWMEGVIPGAVSALSHAGQQARDHGLLKAEDVIHRRGEFLAFPTGVSFGGGSEVPGNLQTPAGQAPIVESLKQDGNVQRIAGFQSTCTFNCGPTTCTFRHVDFNNLPFGLCAITALGNFDPTRGGHLILYGLKLIIEFPPGSTVLIPSGAVEHGNTPVGPTETRMSFTQYAAGGLFRWVAYGFKSVRDTLGGKRPKRGKAVKVIRLAYDLEEGVRWADGVKLFSTPGSIVADRLKVFSKSCSK
ncbi:hypothetical protein DXG01_000548 [Tephrocybe rancida]|nr:hypothetical protein DXG01_000548 [Tephrocybe rancida]